LVSIEFGYVKRFEVEYFGGKDGLVRGSYKTRAQDFWIDSQQAEYPSMGGDGKHLGRQLIYMF